MQHKFYQSRFIWSWFVCIAVLQEHPALPSPQRLLCQSKEKKGEKKGKLAKQHERRGAKPQHAPWGATATAVHAAGKTNCSCMLWNGSMHTNTLQHSCWPHRHVQGFAEPCYSMQAEIALHPWAVVGAAVELLFPCAHIIPLHWFHSQLPHSLMSLHLRGRPGFGFSFFQQGNPVLVTTENGAKLAFTQE